MGVGSTVVSALCRWADERPDGLAFEIDGSEGATWRELRDRVAGTASALTDRGIGANEVVALVGPTGLGLISTLLGLQWIGAVPIVVDPSVPLATTARRLASLGCRRLAADGSKHCELPDAIEVIDMADLRATGRPDPPIVAAPGGVAYLQSSSGATGEPKASTLSHRSLSHQLASLWQTVREDDVFVSWLPLHHDMGLVLFVFMPLHLGQPSHLVQPRLSNLRQWLKTIERVGGTFTAAPDFAYRAAAKLAVRPDLSSLRLAASGGEPVRRSTVEAFEAAFGLGPVVRAGYGLGEATLCVCTPRDGHPRTFDETGVACCGPPLAGLELAIWADDGVLLPRGEVGEIVVRGESVFDGYWGDSQATAAVLRDGWLRTGDLGWLDAEGHLYVSGRRRAMIKRAGQLIPARAVEEVVDDLPGVRRSAALGIIGQSGAEELVVVVECRGDPLPASPLRATAAGAVRTHLGFAPADVVVGGRGTIPLTANGKIRYGELHERLARPNIP